MVNKTDKCTDLDLRTSSVHYALTRHCVEIQARNDLHVLELCLPCTLGLLESVSHFKSVVQADQIHLGDRPTMCPSNAGSSSSRLRIMFRAPPKCLR